MLVLLSVKLRNCTEQRKRTGPKKNIVMTKVTMIKIIRRYSMLHPIHNSWSGHIFSSIWQGATSVSIPDAIIAMRHRERVVRKIIKLL